MLVRPKRGIGPFTFKVNCDSGSESRLPNVERSLYFDCYMKETKTVGIGEII